MSLIPSMTTRGVRALVPGIPVYQPPRRNAVRVRVKRHGVWHDITHRVHRGVVRHTNDDPVATLDLTLLNGEGFDSIAPRVKTSPLNRAEDGSYSPLLDRYNEILVEAAISTDGSEPTDFVPVFHGLLGDDIRNKHTEDAGVVIQVSARDMAKRLQDDFILEPIRFENAYASQIIQGLLNDRFGPGEIQLYVVGDDDFWIDEVTFEYIDTWQAIQSFCEQSDKDVRYLYDPVSGEIRLTYWTPDTTMTPVWNVQPSDIIHETLQTSDASLRHGVVIRYVDADGNRQQVSIVDESLRKPKEPLRIALIEEADTSYIRDEEAAQRMAQAVFAALRTEPATALLRIPFHPYMRIYDVIAVENPKLRSEFELYAIEDLQFHFSADEWWTEITASESVKIRHQIWLAKEAKQGVKAPIKGDELRFGDVPGDRLKPGSVEEHILDPAVFSITPSSVPEPSSGSLEDLWDMNPNTGVTFPSAPITITFRYPVYQGSDLVDLHLGAAAQGYVQMRQRDTGQWVNVLGSPSSPVQFDQGWNRVPFTGNRLYFGREYRLVLLNNVRVNELRFERVTVADKILAGRLRLTGDMAIINEDGTLQITSTGIEMEGQEAGGTQWTPGGLVFLRPDGTRSGYLRAIVPGIAEDGDYVPLNFTNEPVIVLSPARAIIYEPSVGGVQKLRLEATNVSPEGFQVVAKLVRHDAQGNRIVFPRTQKYRWSSSLTSWCTDGGHTTESDARAWSEHRLVTTGSSKTFTIGPGATGAIVRIREMLHAHAYAGDYHAVNTITYLVRIREVGQATWLQTRGPYTRSIAARSSLLSTSFNWSHKLVSHAFGGLPSGEYEIEVTITNKTIRSGQGNNTQSACTLIVEEIEEMSETEIQLPEPITVHYVAFESDSPGGEEDD